MDILNSKCSVVFVLNKTSQAYPFLLEAPTATPSIFLKVTHVA